MRYLSLVVRNIKKERNKKANKISKRYIRYFPRCLSLYVLFGLGGKSKPVRPPFCDTFHRSNKQHQQHKKAAGITPIMRNPKRCLIIYTQKQEPHGWGGWDQVPDGACLLGGRRGLESKVDSEVSGRWRSRRRWW